MFTHITQCIAYRPGHKSRSRGSQSTTGAVSAPTVKGAEVDTAQTHR